MREKDVKADSIFLEKALCESERERETATKSV